MKIKPERDDCSLAMEENHRLAMVKVHRWEDFELKVLAVERLRDQGSVRDLETERRREQRETEGEAVRV